MLSNHILVEPLNSGFAATIDANVVILAISSLNGNTNWSFVGGSFASKIVKLSPSASSGTAVSGSGTTTGITSFTDSGSASHTGTSALYGGVPGSNPPAPPTYPSYPTKLVIGSNGAHTHAWTIGSSLNNSYPPYVDIGAYSANGSVSSLPANTVVFMDNQPSPDLMLISTKSANYEDKHLRIAATEGVIGTTGGSTSFTATYSAGSGGTHTHDSYTSTGSYNPDTVTRTNYLGNSGAHTHTGVSIGFTMETYGVKLRTWITTCSTNLAPGMMMLQKGTATPTNWSVCDGTVKTGASGRTYITPDLTTTAWYLKSTATTSHNTTSGTRNYFSSSSATTTSFAWTHNHNGTTTSANYRSIYHTSYNAAHTHAIPALGGAYDPPATNFCMIMYTP